MSWWISLHHPETDEIPEVARFAEGGTQILGGNTEAGLNVTYNYGKHFDFGALNLRTASETIEELQSAVNRFGLITDPDYWKPIEGNIGHACNILLSWARQFPTYIWKVEQ